LHPVLLRPRLLPAELLQRRGREVHATFGGLLPAVLLRILAVVNPQ
jgi:hypothetical protein